MLKQAKQGSGPKRKKKRKEAAEAVITTDDKKKQKTQISLSGLSNIKYFAFNKVYCSCLEDYLIDCHLDILVLKRNQNSINRFDKTEPCSLINKAEVR